MFFKKTPKNNNKKNVISLWFELVPGVNGLKSICTLSHHVSLEIWFNWSFTRRFHFSHTYLRTRTHNMKLFQLHLDQCGWTEENTYPSASFSCFDYSCVHANAHPYQHTHTRTQTQAHTLFCPKHFVIWLLFTQTVEHARCCLDSRATGALVAL